MSKRAWALSCFIVGALLLTFPVIQSVWNLRRAVAMMAELKFENTNSQAANEYVWQQNFKTSQSGPFLLSWVEPYEYKDDPALQNLSYTYQVLSGTKVLGDGQGHFNHPGPGTSRVEDPKPVELEKSVDYSVLVKIQGPQIQSVLKGFQFKVAMDQESILSEAASSFANVSILSLVLFALGYILIRKED